MVNRKGNNIKPTINVNKISDSLANIAKHPNFPGAKFSNNPYRITETNPHFMNAKAASMAERGLKLHDSSQSALEEKVTKGVYMESDGPETRVVYNGIIVVDKDNILYTFCPLDEGLPDCTKVIKAPSKRYGRDWTFYRYIEPIPFVPRKQPNSKPLHRGGNRKTRKTRRSKKQK